MSLRIWFFPRHPGDKFFEGEPDGELVEAATKSEAKRILLEHLYAEPRVATQSELVQLTKANVEVVRGGE